jgi:O-acetyl-ADP-ribose deacetylase (regulator of RNase III)
MSDVAPATAATAATATAKVAPTTHPLSCIMDTSGKNITGITRACQDAIFSLAPTEKGKENILKKHLSVLRTDTQFANNNKLPAGSATIVDLSKHVVTGKNANGTYLKDKISFILQAATASSGQGDLNAYSLKNMSNSVYNCLYLANINRVKKIAFPILGGRIFFRELLLEQNITKNILYQALLKGAVDFLTDYSGDRLSIEKIIFCSNSKQTYDNVVTNEKTNSVYTKWIAKTKLNSKEESEQNVTKQEVKNLISDGDYLIYSITTGMFNNEWKIMFESGGGGTKDEINKKDLEAFLRKMIDVTNENDFFQEAFNKFPEFLKAYTPPSGKSNFYDIIYPSIIYTGGDNITEFSSIIEHKVKQRGVFQIFESENVEPLAVVNAANTQIEFGTGISGAFKHAIGPPSNDSIDTEGVEIKKAFREAVNKYIKTPTAVSPPVDKPPPKETSSVEKTQFTEVLTGLVGQLSDQSDDHAHASTLGINPKDNFLYPPGGDASVVKKNLNSAEPLIDTMINKFKTASDGDETNFYLGACRSIQAAYDLDMNGVTAGSQEAMRAKLLLNLRKNSLLLKVPARWDYKEMKLGVEPGPPNTIDQLMKYSLQDTIKYYSQEGGDEEKKRFKDLNIAENPTEAVVDGTNISGIDGRFVKGITNYSGSCYFNSALQILLCDDDFIQLLITAICKPISEDEYTHNTRDKFIESCTNYTDEKTKLESHAKVVQDAKDSYNVVTNFTEIFKTIIVNNPNFDMNYYTSIREIVISDRNKARQQDPQEVIQSFLGLFKCISNIYSNKIIDNLNFKKQVYTSNFDGTASTKIIEYESILMINPYIEGKSSADVNSMNTTISQLIKDQKNIDRFIELDEKYYRQQNDAALLVKYNNLSNIVIKSGILYLMYKICTLKKDHHNYNAMVDLIKKYDFTDSATNHEKSYKEISNVITNKYFPTINSELDAIKQFIDNNKTPNIGLNIDGISSICDNVKHVYTFLDSEFKEMTISKNDKNVEHTNIIEINEYFIVSINRALPDQSKSSFSVNIENILKIYIGEQSSLVENNYILQGYCVHHGNHAAGASHWVFIKCNPKTGKEAILLNDDTISVYDSKDSDTYQKGASLFIYKRADESGQGGGGFKPAHNTTASKSKHNSSFKASSSSKSKTKTKNRNHTQRVK